MSKLIKSDHSPLKFDTSQANINCFIRPKSKQKWQEDYRPCSHRHKRRGHHDRDKHLEFQDKAFLESVVCRILNDADCKGINQLIENMVFPSSSSGEAETVKDNRIEEMEQEEISQIFCNFQPLNKNGNLQRFNGYGQNNQGYHILTPSQHFAREEKQERTTTIHSSFNSFSGSPREADTNPEIQMANGMGSLLQVGYSYAYYPQQSPLYQRQMAQRKRRTVSGQQANEFRIVPDRIEADGRTTLMIRHIPNKYSEEMLLEEIGKVHRLRINFLYLPIDHNNSCNVGYAFANFIHTKFILEFYREFNGRRWDRYNSEKICELAYARIQGTTNLMDHYQEYNSQNRGRPASKGEERKKSNVELDDDAMEDINKMLDCQRIEK